MLYFLVSLFLIFFSHLSFPKKEITIAMEKDKITTTDNSILEEKKDKITKKEEIYPIATLKQASEGQGLVFTKSSDLSSEYASFLVKVTITQVVTGGSGSAGGSVTYAAPIANVYIKDSSIQKPVMAYSNHSLNNRLKEGNEYTLKMSVVRNFFPNKEVFISYNLLEIIE